ncbi:CBS domain containing membrane protein [Desulfovibrio sp. X2]|uniref:CBS domain-containing protein n=1 Tax=Desulfovibrio sp. X2 TaxID=941449 RepID=UPI000358C6DC|nr:CBS domain-containing protein [Desulfovibrio sp. X2]EPR42337.1 CBS domain containing membrane protein [Desulfovibrio sp. X2]
MRTALDIMSTDIISVTPDTDIPAAARLLIEKNINGVPVVEDGKLVGILTQSDLITQQKTLKLPSVFTFLDGFVPLGSLDKMEREMRKITAMSVRDAMTPDPVTVSTDTPLEKVAAIMVDERLHTLPVVEGKRLVGVIGKSDVLRTLMGGKE